MFNIRLDAAWFNSRFAVAAGQALLGSLFVVSGLLKLAKFSYVAAMLANFGLPASEGMTVLVILVEVGAGLALALGWHARLAAAVLVPFVVIATLMFHAFWASDAAAYGNQLNHFLKNVALLGALLMVASAGSVPLARSHGQ